MAACDLMISDIHHTRHGQPSHFLARRGLSVWIDLDQLAQANRQSHFFSVGQFNVMSFFESDYGPNFGHKKPVTSLSHGTLTPSDLAMAIADFKPSS